MSELTTGIINALSLSLLHFLWQGALIGILTGIALYLLRNARPQIRYAVACIALLSCLFAVASTLLGALLPIAALDSPQASADITEFASAIANSRGDIAVAAGAALPPWVGPWLAPRLVAVWAAGSGFMFLRLALGLASVRRFRQLPAASQEWQRRLDDLVARFGIHQRVLLLISPGLGSPISVGCWRPIVLLPAALLTRMPANYLEALLAHELAHIRRHDYLINLIQVLIETLLFYHPAVWWLAKQIREEREQIADQLAAGAIGSPRPLALALTELADLVEVSSSTSIACAQAADGGTLKLRIKQLFLARATPVKPARRMLSILLGALGITLSTLGLFACAQLVKEPHIAAQLPTQKSERRDRLSFALVRVGGDSILAWGPDDEIDQVARTLAPRQEDFVLLRRNGRDSLVTNAYVVAPLRRAWENAESLEVQMAQLDLVLEQQLNEMGASTDANATLENAYRENIAQAKRLSREQALAYENVERLLHEHIARSPSLVL